MPQSVYNQIPEGFVIELLGPVAGMWTCDLYNRENSAEASDFGYSPEMAVAACLNAYHGVKKN